MGSVAPRFEPRINHEVYQENGRYYGTFRKGKYMFPIDETEMDRMDMMHKFFLVARKDQLHSSPFHNEVNPRTLDLGCGTGIWSIQMADKYSQGYHVGLDLNYIQPEFIPPNTEFQQKDIEVPWQDLNPGTWDLIHLRSLNGSISNWPRLYGEIIGHLRPHYGYVEQLEIDYIPRSDDGSLKQDSCVLYGLTKQRLADAGFVDIKEEIIDIALNGWPGDYHGMELGRWFNLGLTQGLEALSLAPLCRGHNKSSAEVIALVDRVKEEIRSRRLHAYCTLHIYTARKP
ncbi:S-adenosyl-L-methionine-dependent methyltransferase [Podospora didyma]|uniref:S-adenosyl-L-methionine-dependent methyltransferase n=1 Tax=Podospora didyma TaxID=330526 RepID=A0AAE0P5P2_9PEZI|nr:S-adenosyl-L-methionine-dependent methyltransferase [Podospora didyma]